MAKVSKNDIATVVNDFVTAKEPIDKIAKALASYLVSERRTKELDSIMRKVSELRTKQGLYEAEVTSVHKLDEQTKKELAKIVYQNYPNTKKVILDEKQDASLVGGAIFKASDIYLNLSIHDRLSKLPQLINNTVQGRY